MIAEAKQADEFVRWRAAVLGAVLAVVFSAINGYLSINLGWSFGYGAVAVIIGYSLFHRRDRPYYEGDDHRAEPDEGDEVGSEDPEQGAGGGSRTSQGVGG